MLIYLKYLILYLIILLALVDGINRPSYNTDWDPRLGQMIIMPMPFRQVLPPYVIDPKHFN